MRFLIADDHLLFAEGLSLVIGQMYPESTCFIVNHFHEAISCPAIADVNLLFLDWHMPGMQGVHSIKTLQKFFPSLPICVISSDQSQSIISHVLATGASGFIHKATAGNELKRAIEIMLTGKFYMPKNIVLDKALLLYDEEVTGALGYKPIRLTQRQLQILNLLMEGSANKVISQKLGIQDSTLKSYLKIIFKLLDARNRTEAVNKARRLGLI